MLTLRRRCNRQPVVCIGLEKHLRVERSDGRGQRQQSGDVLGANEVIMNAFYTDVRPALADLREERGLPRDPMAAYSASGYQEEIERTRVGGNQAGWGA
jgi:L-rhamnose isomerase/sugar isomerase